MVFQKHQEVVEGNQTIQLNLGSASLNVNAFVLQIQDEDGNSNSQKLMRTGGDGFQLR